MRELLILAIHLLVTLVKLLRPGGVGAVAAQSLLIKHQLLISNRSRQRAPNLTTLDRLVLGLSTLFVNPRRIAKLGALVRPATLLKFQKALVDRKYRLLFSSASHRRKPGPKGPSGALIAAILEIKRRNPRFGCVRIAQQISHAFGVPIDKQKLRWCKLVFFLGCAILLHTVELSAEQVPVDHTEGLLHGFLALRTLEGKILADGEVTQFAEGDRVRSHLIFHFKDGSVYEEAAAFSQQGRFRLLSDHVIQKGPAFKDPMETSIDASTGHVMVRYTDENGKEQVADEHLSLPEDVANGLLFTLVRHIQPSVPQTIVSEVAMTPKPRLVGLMILPQGEEPFSSGSTRYKAVRYVVRVKIGGVAGLLAPLLGKKPPDMQIWIKRGEAPAFVKFEGPLYNGGPIWRVELADPARF